MDGKERMSHREESRNQTAGSEDPVPGWKNVRQGHQEPLLHLRMATPALRHGTTTVVVTNSDALFAHLRSDAVTDYTLDLASGPLRPGMQTTPLRGSPATPPDVNSHGGFDGYRPVSSVPGYGAVIIDLEA